MMQSLSISFQVFFLGFVISLGMAAMIKGLVSLIKLGTKKNSEETTESAAA